MILPLFLSEIDDNNFLYTFYIRKEVCVTPHFIPKIINIDIKNHI